MKKMVMFVLLLSMTLLAACSATQAAAAPAGDAATANGAPGQAGLDASKMDDATKLVIGTLELEGSDQAVTAEQARTLLPLWKAVKSLGTSDSTAQGEINALYAQIKETMTAAQLESINTLSFSQEDMGTLMSDLGIEMGGAGAMPDVSEDQQATMQALRQSSQRPQGGGGFPGGGPGGQMPGAPGGVPGQEGQDSTTTGTPNRGMGMARMFIDPLIKLLEERAAR